MHFNLSVNDILSLTLLFSDTSLIVLVFVRTLGIALSTVLIFCCLGVSISFLLLPEHKISLLLSISSILLLPFIRLAKRRIYNEGPELFDLFTVLRRNVSSRRRLEQLQ